ncbi:pilus assembly protein N-terminal domain-containing protein [Dysgonomonas sp. ZJ279]|uniref:pilus assembly protein N-terminal domain-containing protein n=1 Tax=Dysgonomonas sp. ZJ279 TaxID=2709796 RepID=UPI0013ED4ACE|nr:pilus assembly protein N-terminal domain-containing protein [Dysgonomonas sp. ZJ279]
MKQIKTLLFLFTISLCMVLTSCEDDDDRIHFSQMIYPEDNAKITSIEITDIHSATVEVKNAKGTLSGKSDNEEIVTVEISDINYVTLTGHKLGTTTISVTDSENRTATLTVTVVNSTSSLFISEHQIEVLTDNITNTDQILIGNIKAEITAELPPVGGGFKLLYTSSEEGKLTYYPDIKDLNTKQEGTFRYNYDEALQTSFLILKYNDKEYVYRMSHGNRSQSATKTSIISGYYLIRDFTEDYKEMTDPKITKAEGGLYARIANNF